MGDHTHERSKTLTARQRKATPAHPLAHLIPNRADFAHYVRRQIGGYWDLDILAYARATGANTLLAGPTGPGKTLMIETYCARYEDDDYPNGLPLVTIQSHGGIDPNVFWGGPGVDAQGNIVPWIDSSALQVIQFGGVLYIDEVNFLHPRAAAGVHDLTDHRRQVTILERQNTTYKASPGLQVICAYNPDYEGTRPLNQAFKNRFKIKMAVGYDREVEEQLVNMPVLLDLAHRIRNSIDAVETPVSTNMLMEFEELCIDLDLSFARANFLAAFAEDEREAISDVFNLMADRLENEAAALQEAATSDD